MILKGEFLFMGRSAVPNRTDPTRTNYLASFQQGMDNKKFFLNEELYNSLDAIPFLSPVTLTLNYNPMSDKAQYVITLAGCVENKQVSSPAPVDKPASVKSA